MQGVIEAVEIIEQTDRRQQLNNLAFVVVPPQFLPELVIDAVGIERGPLCQLERGFFGVSEIGAVAEICEIAQLLLGPAMPPCQGGVRSQSILAAVELRSAHNRQLLQFGGHRSSVHDRTEVSNHRAKDFWSMRYRTEHVGNVSALLLVGVKYLRGFWIDLVFVET